MRRTHFPRKGGFYRGGVRLAAQKGNRRANFPRVDISPGEAPLFSVGVVHTIQCLPVIENGLVEHM